jgi:hypothetical protein
MSYSFFILTGSFCPVEWLDVRQNLFGLSIPDTQFASGRTRNHEVASPVTARSGWKK